MSHDPDVSVFRLGGIPVADIDMAGLAASVGRYLAGDRRVPGTFIAFCGAHGVVESASNAALRAAHEAAWLVVPDGRPLFWMGRLKGCRTITQVPGIESVEALCRAGARTGWRHYFVGGGPGVARRLAGEMSARVPGLQVAGCETPPFRPLEPAEAEAMRERIRASAADLVWIGLGTPKQELFMAEQAPLVPGTIWMGVGAAFDVNIGTIARAPRLLQLAGCEWAYRLAREPRRLWRRYAVVVPRFVQIALVNLVRA
jgi:N-acetylglucosaminyldiphosphoundecaprenol N-acetyl-beta-D-mannosaminyltransferase